MQSCHYRQITKESFLFLAQPKTGNAKRERDCVGTRSSPHTLQLKMAGQLIWYNNNCIMSMRGFVWVIFFKKSNKRFLLSSSPNWMWMDGFIFSVLFDVSLCMYGHALLLMGIYNNYSGCYKVRRRLYVNGRFVKLTRSGKNIKQWAWQNMETYSMLGVLLRNMTWNWL